MKPLKIMVVDDEPFICELMNEFLSLHGYEVTTVNSGEDAVLKINTIKPDMVLLDIWMPGMSGLEALCKIKEINHDVRVVMLSAFGDEDTVEQAINMGASYYLQKPIEFKELSKILKQWHNSEERI